jgi:F-box protein 9
MPSQGESTAPDTEELAHFRERWKEEIREREQKGQQWSLSQSKPGQTAQATSTLKSLSSAALEVFTLAVTEERNGNQSEANRLYLSAFRLDPNVDMAYHGDDYRPPWSPFISSSSLSLTVATPPSPEGNKGSGPSQDISTISTLASLFESWSHPLLFTPEDEAIGVSINKLPDELIVSILSKFAENMDVTSIERFAVVSRRARVLSLDRSVWRWVGISNARDAC